jgi:hypothetical protein
MLKGDQEKALLFHLWLNDHKDGNVFPLFSTDYPDFKLTTEAKAFFSLPEQTGLYLYILLARNIHDEYVPLYIGKTSSPRDRWINGHLRSLNRAVETTRPASYSKWIHSLESMEGELHLFCIHESKVKAPSIPGFPQTIGSIEYQLVSLANDAFPGKLLNSEGVGR